MTGHGLTVEQVPDARLVEWMCQMRPGLPVQYADLALQALRSLHMTVHRDAERCGHTAGPGPVHECRVWEVDGEWNVSCTACPDAVDNVGSEDDAEQWAAQHLAAGDRSGARS